MSEDVVCNLCGDNAQKGENCPSCPAYRRFHYVEGVGGNRPGTVDIFIVAEYPDTSGPSGNIAKHEAFSMGMEKIVRTTALNFLPRILGDHSVTIRCTYATRCGKEKPPKKMYAACAPLFFEELELLSNPKRDILIFGCGPTVAKSLGFTKGRYTDFHGKVYTTTLPSGRRVILVPTFSLKHLAAKTGYYELLTEHMRELVRAYLEGVPTVAIRDEIIRKTSENYRLPKTLAEAKELVDYILSYSAKKDATQAQIDSHPIAVDTESNTKYPNRPRARIATVHVAWDTGHAATLPFEHPDAPWSPEEIFPVIKKLLECPKPKIGHNFKYDLELFDNRKLDVDRFAWDTMLAEHLLEEDKKGYYSLKDIVTTQFPEYAGYEDALHDSLVTPRAARKAQYPDRDDYKGAAAKIMDDNIQNGFMDASIEDLHVYGCLDVDLTRRLYREQVIRMRKEEAFIARKREPLKGYIAFKNVVKSLAPVVNPLENLVTKHAVPIAKTLAKIERTGVRIDRDYVQKLSLTMTRSIIEYEDALTEMVPSALRENINLNSAPQLRSLLFSTGFHNPKIPSETLFTYEGVVEPPRTATGEISLNAAFLRTLAISYDCPFSDTLLKYRKLVKARDTFLRNVEVLSREDGRMHTTYNLHGTSTGRLSSVDENMQNIPHFLAGHNIKKMCIPDEGMVFVNADAKAAEVRVFAAYSKDKALIEALCAGLDPHSFFSSRTLNPETALVGVPPEEHRSTLETIGIDLDHPWSYEDFENRGELMGSPGAPGPDIDYGKRLDKLRKNIKRVVFGILYGASQYKIASIVGIPDAQAQKIIDVLFQMFPSIVNYIEATKQQIHHIGMVETFFGRRRRFNLAGLTRKLIGRAERQAVNCRIQSTSSDIVLATLVAMTDAIERDFQGDVLLTVHDSVGFQVPIKYASQIPDFIQEYGVKAAKKNYPWLPVPFQWDVEMGPSYGEVIPAAKYLEQHNVSVLYDSDEYEQDIREEFENIA
jgi:DNA polymerase I-like protein with 3'-5' exonuclease and polymerase domains/uracil-DNA glycosylase